MLRRALLVAVFTLLSLVVPGARADAQSFLPIKFWNVTNWNGANNAWINVRYPDGDTAIRAQFAANEPQCGQLGSNGLPNTRGAVLADTYPFTSNSYPYWNDSLVYFHYNVIDCTTGQVVGGPYGGDSAARQYVHCEGQSDTYWTYDENDLWHDTYGGTGQWGCNQGFYLVAPVEPPPAGNCNHNDVPCSPAPPGACPLCDSQRNGQPSVQDPIAVGTGNMFLRQSDLAAADPRLRFSRVYNSNYPADVGSLVGNGWQAQLGDRYIGQLDASLPGISSVFLEVSTVYATASDACVKGWPQIASGGGVSAKADPKWAGVTATYTGSDSCSLSNGKTLHILGTGPQAGIGNSVDVGWRGISARRGDGSLYFLYCSQGVCQGSGPYAKFTVTLDTNGYTLHDQDGNSEHYDYLGFLS